jgi:hypothetical protein
MASRFTASGVSLLNTSGAVVAYQAPNFTNPSGCAIVISSLIGNGYPGDAIASMNIAQGSTFISTIVNQVIVPSGSSLEIIPNKVILTSGQSLQFNVVDSGNITSTTSVLEIY